VADEPSPWELQRTLAAIREDMREGFKGLNQRLDKHVTTELFNAHLEAERSRHEEHKEDIAAIATAHEADKRQRATDRRMIWMAVFTSILAPLVLLLISSYLRSKGTP
jgi:ABC-type nickel/cobalt efflux system permease component RcnA